jgi:hypothetical protein
MLVLKVNGDYKKKATGKTIFTCNQGILIKQTIEEAVFNKQARTISLTSTGRNEAGDVVAEFTIEWSFKGK